MIFAYFSWCSLQHLGCMCSAVMEGRKEQAGSGVHPKIGHHRACEAQWGHPSALLALQLQRRSSSCSCCRCSCWWCTSTWCGAPGAAGAGTSAAAAAVMVPDAAMAALLRRWRCFCCSCSLYTPPAPASLLSLLYVCIETKLSFLVRTFFEGKCRKKSKFFFLNFWIFFFISVKHTNPY